MSTVQANLDNYSATKREASNVRRAKQLQINSADPKEEKSKKTALLTLWYQQ
jgi:hypothetical protein